MAKILAYMLVAAILAGLHAAHAQQQAEIHRIRYLSALSASFQSFRIEAFGQGLRELGYWKEKKILVDDRYAEGKLDRAQ